MGKKFVKGELVLVRDHKTVDWCERIFIGVQKSKYKFVCHARDSRGKDHKGNEVAWKYCKKIEKKQVYKPLKIVRREVHGVYWALRAMRLPKKSEGDSTRDEAGPMDLKLASALIRAGDDHAKAVRGIVVWLRVEFQVGFMIEFETYRHGVECLSTSSAMHGELKQLTGVELAEQKQRDLPEKVYTRDVTFSYQSLRSIYKARKMHRHPDWRIFCKFIETLPYFDSLIYPEAQKK